MVKSRQPYSACRSGCPQQSVRVVAPSDRAVSAARQCDNIDNGYAVIHHDRAVYERLEERLGVASRCAVSGGNVGQLSALDPVCDVARGYGLLPQQGVPARMKSNSLASSEVSPQRVHIPLCSWWLLIVYPSFSHSLRTWRLLIRTVGGSSGSSRRLAARLRSRTCRWRAPRRQVAWPRSTRRACPRERRG